MKMITLNCLFCQKSFERAECLIKCQEKSRGQVNSFCSQLCKNTYYKSINRVKVTCGNCDTEHETTKNIITSSKSGKVFCSQSCAAIYNNAHKTKGTRVSKLEVWIKDQLTLLYPNLEILYNRKDIINSELDIYIPSLRLAVELNGIFHYEPIYGEEKLKQIQNNDTRKFQACIEHNIELIIIDSSQLKAFKAEKAKKYLDIISNIINSK